MKIVRVVAAIIKEQDKIYATQRGYGPLKGMWEFPGGKIELNETKEEALKREIKEELDVEIIIDKQIATIEYAYSDFYLIMDCFLVKLSKGTIVLKEHMAARWLSKNELDEVEWLEADIALIEQLKKIL